jgi:hypothetical protein
MVKVEPPQALMILVNKSRSDSINSAYPIVDLMGWLQVAISS